MYKVIHPDDPSLHQYDDREFAKVMKIDLINQLEFESDDLLSKIERKSQRAASKGELSIRQKWLGEYYHKEIQTATHPDVTISWIDSHIGYGVFANTSIPPQTYIGQYTGVLRKKRWFSDRSNNYSFVYSIGEKHTKYVIDASNKGNHTRFINHSSCPNLEPVSVFCDGMMHMILLSTKAIEKGEQLSYDYGDEYWRKREEAKMI